MIALEYKGSVILLLWVLSEWAVNMGEILSILVKDEETNISYSHS